MEETWVKIMLELGIWAIPLNLLVNTLLNLAGFIPSVFITTTNVLVWGPIWGGLLSWLGEILGAETLSLNDQMWALRGRP